MFSEDGYVFESLSEHSAWKTLISDYRLNEKLN